MTAGGRYGALVRTNTSSTVKSVGIVFLTLKCIFIILDYEEQVVYIYIYGKIDYSE